MASSNRILLYGNGESTAEIDESVFDTIVRFNWGLRDEGRTDVWVDALLQHEKKIRHHYMRAGHPEIWRLNGELDGRRLSHMPSEWYKNTTFISPRNYKKMAAEFKSHWKPSIGFVCIWWLLNVQNEQDITITGFDSGKSKNRYTGESPYTSHDWEKERLILEAWIDDGSLKRL